MDWQTIRWFHSDSNKSFHDLYRKGFNFTWRGKQRTEEQSGEDESELFKETHSVGPGNLSSFEITIIFKRTQDHV